MSYIHDNLMAEEEIIIVTKPHWIIFVRSLCWALVTLAVFVAGYGFGILDVRLFAKFPPLYVILGLVTLAAAFISALSTALKYVSTEFAITNKRVVVKQGLIRRSTLELLLMRIESISIYQSLFGRLLDYGSLLISGTGGSRDPILGLPQPNKLRNLVQEQIERIP